MEDGLTQALTQPLGSLDSVDLLLPILHPESSRGWVTGTGLTHLGSAATRNSMHSEVAEADLTDSMKMFRMGVEGGRPFADQIGAQPEWFYKGNQQTLVPSGGALTLPAFSMDGGDESELAGVYLIRKDGQPMRIGFALANEFSDHVMEKINYLYLAHSKLRVSSIASFIKIGPPPGHVQGHAQIERAGEVIWHKEFLSGNDHMCHSIENLEHHHFKYDLFCRPEDVHIHYMGTSTLSFADKITTQTGDTIRLQVDGFGPALENTVRYASEPEKLIKVEQA